VDRRRFLLLSLAASGSLTIGRGALAPAFAAPAQPGESPYGPLGAPGPDGLRLPEGFSARVVKQWGQPIGPTDELAMPFPDGAATFPTDDGGWILVSNSENPPPVDVPNPPELGGLGGVQAIRFDAAGEIVDAYPILSGSRSNCAGGVTPWGTWLSCEEVDDRTDASRSGRVFECDPTGEREAVDLPLLGRFKHENAAVDPDRGHVYLTEDLGDGCFYRFAPTTPGDLTDGVLEVAIVEEGRVRWTPVPDPICADGVPCRQQVAGATPFDGGEGCVYDQGLVFVTTKGDDRVWVHDVAAQTMEVLYDAADFDEPVLTGVDHIIVQPGTGNLVVAEDGGDMQVVMIRREDFAVFPVLQMTGPQHGQALPGPASAIPTTSEVSGLAFSPDGSRLYCNSQRGFVGGVTYEVQGPWVPAAEEAPTAPERPGRGRPDEVPPAEPPRRGPGVQAAGATAATLPATGGGDLGLLAVGATAGAAGLLALRRRLDERLR